MRTKLESIENGVIYENAGGGTYRCIRSTEDGAIMQNVRSGWTFEAVGLGIYENGTIDWDRSRNGYFVSKVLA